MNWLIKFFKFDRQNITKINICGIVIDIVDKTITIPKEFKIIFEGDGNITSNKNINISSNYKNVDENGEPYKIYMNSED